MAGSLIRKPNETAIVSTFVTITPVCVSSGSFNVFTVILKMSAYFNDPNQIASKPLTRWNWPPRHSGDIPRKFGPSNRPAPKRLKLENYMFCTGFTTICNTNHTENIKNQCRRPSSKENPGDIPGTFRGHSGDVPGRCPKIALPMQNCKLMHISPQPAPKRHNTTKQSKTTNTAS